MFGMKGFYMLVSGAKRGHHGPLVDKVENIIGKGENAGYQYQKTSWEREKMLVTNTRKHHGKRKKRWLAIPAVFPCPTMFS